MYVCIHIYIHAIVVKAYTYIYIYMSHLNYAALLRAVREHVCRRAVRSLIPCSGIISIVVIVVFSLSLVLVVVVVVVVIDQHFMY